MIKVEKGYSLVEVLVAMTILVIAVMPMFGTYPKLMQSTQRSVQTEESARLAMTVIEYIKAKGYTTVSSIVANSSGGVFNKTYTLVPDNTTGGNAGTYTSSPISGTGSFQSDFGYVDGGINFFLLNSKYGMSLGSTQIQVMIDTADVYVRDTTDQAIITPVGGDNRQIYKGFIIGKVVIIGASNTKEVKFVMTPIE